MLYKLFVVLILLFVVINFYVDIKNAIHNGFYSIESFKMPEDVEYKRKSVNDVYILNDKFYNTLESAKRGCIKNAYMCNGFFKDMGGKYRIFIKLTEELKRLGTFKHQNLQDDVNGMEVYYRDFKNPQTQTNAEMQTTDTLKSLNQSDQILPNSYTPNDCASFCSTNQPCTIPCKNMGCSNCIGKEPIDPIPISQSKKNPNNDVSIGNSIYNRAGIGHKTVNVKNCGECQKCGPSCQNFCKINNGNCANGGIQTCSSSGSSYVRGCDVTNDASVYTLSSNDLAQLNNSNGVGHPDNVNSNNAISNNSSYTNNDFGKDVQNSIINTHNDMVKKDTKYITTAKIVNHHVYLHPGENIVKGFKSFINDTDVLEKIDNLFQPQINKTNEVPDFFETDSANLKNATKVSQYTQPKQYTSNQTNNMIQNTHKYTQNYKPLDPSINPSPYDSCVLK